MNKVRFLAPDTDAYVSSVLKHSDEFRERSGLELEAVIIPSDEYFSNNISAYLKGDNRADVFMSGPVLLWEHIGGDLVEPLDDYLSSSGEAFDFEDFLPSLISCNRWTGRFGDQLGSGSLWEIPVNWESYNLAYNPAALVQAGLAPPNTWDEYFTAARKISNRTTFLGFGQRGVQVWHTMYTGYASQFWSCGGRDFNDDGLCAIAQPEGVEATRAFIDGLKDAGPSDWTNQRWYELAMDFAAGKYGMIVDSDHYVAFFEDDSVSTMKGKIHYALPPAGPGGIRKPNLWTWSLAMNSRSERKNLAWKFIEWAAGKDFLLRSAFEGNMNPTRLSSWENDDFKNHIAVWGDFHDVARRLVDQYAKVQVTPSIHYLQIADRWTAALRSSYSGEENVATELSKAAADINKIIKDGN